MGELSRFGRILVPVRFDDLDNVRDTNSELIALHWKFSPMFATASL